MNIGLKIKELRTKKRITQEELANVVGVSTQAVSKWENGGLPDIELLPSIANYFNVSTDFLFGLPSHEFDNCEQLLAKYIASIPNKKDKYQEVLNMCWNMEKPLFGNHNVKECPLDDTIARKDLNHSQIVQKEGVTMMRLAEDGSFFFIAPKPEAAFNFLLNTKQKQLKAFELLSKEDFYNALIFLNTRDNKNFTTSLLMKEFELSLDRSQEIIEDLKSLNLLETTEIELDDEIRKTYSLRNNPAIIGLLSFVDMIVNRPNGFCYNIWDVNVKYFNK